jgi:hypothetical protein
MKQLHRVIELPDWLTLAKQHSMALESMLYPSGKDLKTRQHSITHDPVYNFLNKYYRYSANELMKFSPGYGVVLSGANLQEHADLLNPQHLVYDDAGCWYNVNEVAKSPLFGRYGRSKLSSNRDIMAATIIKKPFLGCFGLHEWAMLYSGAKQQQQQPIVNSTSSVSGSSSNVGDGGGRHQENLPLRVSQGVIDSVVNSQPLRCTHYDAFRFFHRDAKGMNTVKQLSRTAQTVNEQPGCVHATMDLFRYAYELYPLTSSDLLQRALRVAITARQLDMRASPYDVSAFSGCEEAIPIETAEGRRRYVAEQERLAQQSQSVRAALLAVYNDVLAVHGGDAQ